MKPCDNLVILCRYVIVCETLRRVHLLALKNSNDPNMVSATPYEELSRLWPLVLFFLVAIQVVLPRVITHFVGIESEKSGKSDDGAAGKEYVALSKAKDSSRSRRSNLFCLSSTGMLHVCGFAP